MNRNLTRCYALCVAIAAVALVVLKVANLIQEMGFSLTDEGFAVVWQQDVPWDFVATIESWWVWILGAISMVFLLFCREKKHSDFGNGPRKLATD